MNTVDIQSQVGESPAIGVEMRGLITVAGAKVGYPKIIMAVHVEERAQHDE